MITILEAKSRLIEVAENNSEFRELLLADPTEAAQQLFKMKMPDGIALKVHEESPDSLHIVLSPVNADELSDIELEAVSGGTCWDYEEPIPCDFNY